MEYYLAREKTYICVTFNESVQPAAYYSEQKKKLERERQILSINAYKWDLGRQ